MIDFKRLPEDKDDFYRYLWRVGKAIEDGTAECTWNDAAPYINEEWGNNYTQSAYRKPVQYTIPFYEHVFSGMSGADYEERLSTKMDEMYRLKRQLLDQRREYNNILVKEARAEHLQEIVKEAADRLSPGIITHDKNLKLGEEEAILCLADWHYGMKTENIWNKFDTKICIDRVSELVVKVKEAIALHKIKKLHILCLGDFAHGACHVGCRVASEELVCDQLMQVSEILSEVIEALSEHVSMTDVYMAFGNHMRTVQKKKDSIHDDNMEKIIPWFLAERFKSRKDIKVHISEYGEIVMFECCGHSIFATHGDIDKFDNMAVTANTLSNKVTGKNVEYVIVGDKHSTKEYDSFGIKAIQVACLCGTDEYAHTHRLYSEPGQTMLIFNKSSGRKCTYNISFKQ